MFAKFLHFSPTNMRTLKNTQAAAARMNVKKGTVKKNPTTSVLII
jgi:hypothetical protein